VSSNLAGSAIHLCTKMPADEKTTFYDSLVNGLKNNRVIAIGLLVVVIATGGASVVLQLLGVWDQLFGARVVLAAINVAPSETAPFRDGPGIPCLLQDKVMRTFDARSEHTPGSPLPLAFTFSNHAKVDAIFTAADFVVTHTQQTAGGGPGTVEPNHTYKMNLAFKTGTQTLALNPPYRIQPNETGAFTIDISPAADGTGLCWILYIAFHTNLGTIKTEPFAVTMSKSPR
jgi:hypothetical protein